MHELINLRGEKKISVNDLSSPLKGKDDVTILTQFVISFAYFIVFLLVENNRSTHPGRASNALESTSIATCSPRSSLTMPCGCYGTRA